MRISEVVKFLEDVKDNEGDHRIESITGFWIETIVETGERIVVPVVGDGKTIKDLKDAPR